jgi:uncharacterized protein
MKWVKVGDRYFFLRTEKSQSKFLIQTLPFRVFALPNEVSDEEVKEWVELQTMSAELEEKSFEGFYALDVVITTKCNFRCIYCYALSSKAQGFYGLKPQDMDTGIVEESLLLIMEYFEQEIVKSNGKDARFDLFITGGEPLLNYNTMVFLLEKVEEYIERLSTQYSIAIEYSPELATNASLVTDQIARRLKEYNVQVVVTVDGPMHNERRPFADGRGSLSQVLGGIERLIRAGNKLKLQAVVPLGDTNYLDLLFSFYEKHGLLDEIKRVHVIPQAASILDRYYSLPSRLSGFSEQAYDLYANELIRLSEKFNLDVKNYQGRLFRSINVGGLAHRCPAGRWKIAVTPSGDLYPCHQLINIPEFHAGNVRDSNVKQKVEKIAQIFQSRSVFKVRPCENCIFQTICIPFVDCPARCFLETGDLFEVPQHYCRVHRPYMEKLLEDFIIHLAESA